MDASLRVIESSTESVVADDELAPLLADLYLPRLIEERLIALVRQGQLGKWFSGIGQEAVAVGVAHALRPEDWIVPLHRNLGVFTTRGVDLDRLLRQLLGRADSYTEGRDRSFHFGSLPDHLVGMISHLGAMLPVACGLALAGQLRGEDRVVVVFSGDGGASEGDTHEAMNLAAVWSLPVVFVIENNGYALSTPTREQFRTDGLVGRAAAYGMPGEVVDGNDVLAVIRAVREAAERARRGGGPTLLECRTFRLRGHEEASGTDYVPPELIAEWAARDPIARLERVAEERGVLDADGRTALRVGVAERVEAVVRAARAAPEPASDAATERAAVHAVAAPAAAPVRPAPGPERPLRYLDAVSDGLREAMRADDRVVLLGQDIAEYGGAFKVTAGFVEEFGRARVRNTPIIESGALGCALGLALDGFLPVVEMQFGDFISCGFNQIVNNLATTHYRWGAPVPVVIRVPSGGGLGAGPFHSQNVEGWFTHVPGLKIVAPATAADAKGLLLAAIDDPNPVLFLEHKALYRREKGPVAEGWAATPIGSAVVARPGRHVSVVTYGVGVSWALEAASALEGDGVEVEVVDLRSLQPWDADLAAASVGRTGRALVLHEAPVTGGFGAEVASVLTERCFFDLDVPIVRLGSLDTPIPASGRLEEITSPRARLLGALAALAGA